MAALVPYIPMGPYAGGLSGASPGAYNWPALGQPVALSANFVFTACAAAGDNTVPLNGPLLLIILASVTGTTTFTSVADYSGHGRAGDITTYTTAAGLYSCFFFRPDGWRNADGNLHFVTSAVTVTAAAFQINAI